MIVDCNGLAGVLEPLVTWPTLNHCQKKFCALRNGRAEVDGHAIQDIHTAVNQAHSRPLAVVAKTIKGCGVSFMENRMEWHYLPLNAQQYEQARNEVQQACEMSSADH